MAVKLLAVWCVGVLAAAAADDVSIRWWVGAHASIPCEVPQAQLIPARRPPPPLEADDRPRAKPYMWWRGEDRISSNRVSPNGTVEVRRREGSDGVYRCAVRHHAGLVMGYPVHLKIPSIDKQFTAHPENVTVRAGQPVALSCVISSVPAADVQWLKDDEELPDDDRYHQLQKQLLISDVTNADAGVYRCTASNPYLNKTRTSHAGTLTVTEDTRDEEPRMLAVDVEKTIAASQGSRVVLPCPVTGRPRPKLIWELSPPVGLPSELEYVNEVLVLQRLEYDQEGVYTCSVEGYSGLAKTFNVTVIEPPEIKIPPTGKEALRASTVRFNCTATGKPVPTVTWYKDGTPLSMAGRINLRKSTDGQRTELVISGVTSDDAGVYQCFAQNTAGTASSWAVLNVTGVDAAAPTNVRCWPVGDRKVRVTWDKPAVGEVVAYTVHGTPEESKAGNSLPGHPLQDTEEIVTVASALSTYRFQVRAYSRLTATIKNAASDFSKPAVCQGQGVPIKMARVDDSKVIISWKQFAEDNPGVVKWMVQHRAENSNDERNVTLDKAVTNYTLTAHPNAPLQVRVLGSRTAKWLRQDLSLVPWVSTANAGRDLEAGDITSVPQDLDVTQVGSRYFTVTWRYDEADKSDKYVFMVCAKKVDGNDKCQESKKNSATFEDLEPNSEYEVIVQARIPKRALGGRFSQPYLVTTLAESPERFKGLKGQFVNSSTLNISWNGPKDLYTVHYSAQLKLPVEQWDSVETDSNSVLISGIDASETTFVMVTAYDPLEHSKIETIPPQIKASDAKELQYEYTSNGVRISWSDTSGAARVVSYGQNITWPVEQWRSVVATQPSVELIGLDPELPVYVMVTTSKKLRSDRNQVLTIYPRPKSDNSWYLAAGVTCGVFLLCLIAIAAVCLWLKRKKAPSPRHRRRNAAANEGNDEEGAELKSVGGRLANGGGSKDAGEPLLNGHITVHITENPTSKTPNGKMKKSRLYEAAFDVSRYEDPDTTLETVLDADISTSTAYNLLDTSRRPDDSRSSRDISTNNSFSKLPDDNMNSELTRSTFELDNSKIPPTLQPNG